MEAATLARGPAAHTFPPGPALASFVEAIELPSDVAAERAPAAYTVLPGPRPVLGLQLRGRLAALRGGEARVLDGAGLTGLQTVARRFVPESETRTLIVRFQPYGAAALFGPRLGDCADQHVGLSDLVPPEFARLVLARLALASDDREAGRVVTAALAALLRRERFTVPTTVRRAADTIVQRHGEIRVATLADDLGVAARTLERGFRACIGVSPKQFAGVARFAWAAEQLDGATTATRVAQDAGFTDQAQLSREFARRLGVAPSRWRGSR